MTQSVIKISSYDTRKLELMCYIKIIRKHKKKKRIKIICGLKNGALLQRDENNVCKCLFKAETNGEMKSSILHLQKSCK